MRARGSGAQIQSGEAKMWHGAGHRKAAGDCGPCDRHVRSGAESPQDSARSFENARISSGDSGSEQKLGTCSVDVNYIPKIKSSKYFTPSNAIEKFFNSNFHSFYMEIIFNMDILPNSLLNIFSDRLNQHQMV